MKTKKLVALVLVAVLAFTSVVGGTLAYFADTDQQVNTFVTGNVEIDLFEDFGDNDGIEKLLPVTYDAQGNRKADNVIEKEVYVENTGSEDAYVRVHIAIPNALDDGAYTFNAGNNILHFNADADTYVDGKWNWDIQKDGNDALTGNAMVKNGWNYYETTIDGIKYNVYVVTYETALETGDVTEDAMSQVYLDKTVTNETITRLKAVLGDEWHIYVAAEGVQAEGFADAYEALNTEFGTPTATGYITKVNWKAAAKPDTFKDVA